MRRPLVNISAPGRWFIPGDWHIPNHHRALSTLMLRHAADLRPNFVLLQGDTVNAQGLSRFRTQKDPVDQVSLKREAAAAAPLLHALAATATDGAYAGPGNHEKFIIRLAGEEPAFQDMEWWEAWDPAFADYQVLPADYRAKIGHLIVEHGDDLKGSLQKQSAHNVLRNYPTQNTLYGHTHRIQHAQVSTAAGGVPTAHGAWTIGTLADPDRMDGQDSDGWQYGWAVVDVRASGRFTVTQLQAHWKGNRPEVWCPLLKRLYR